MPRFAPGPRRFFFLTAALMVLVAALFDFSLFAVSAGIDASGARADALSAWISPHFAGIVHSRFWGLVVPVSAAICLGVALILGGAHQRALARAEMARPAKARKRRRVEPAPAGGPPAPDPVAAKNRDRRIFVHLLAMMQREGRLVDFLAEDLDGFDDAQIGAAVRTIHRSCGQLLQSKLSFRPLMDADEGETVTIAPGFDPGAVTLTGNVVGEPPFSGVVRHRGWRLGRIDMPALSDTEDAAVLAPAEVEIV